jgi:NNP family nitrate/nitrite transporter-like MFS transporter
MGRLAALLGGGDWKSLLACFLYFDTGFTVWVMLGPLAPDIERHLALSGAQAAFLVAVPALGASMARVTLGNWFQASDGRRLALLSIAISARAPLMLLLPIVPTYPELLALGALLGVGGASFAIALPMAGSGYPPRVQGLVLGLAAAGNVGAVIDGFVLPSLAAQLGWQHAAACALPLLALAAVAVTLWARDRTCKSGSSARALLGFVISMVGFLLLVQLANAGLFGGNRASQLLLPLLSLALAGAVLPRRYRTVLAERDTWVVMLIYAITFGGFVGMSSYVSLLLTTQYHISKIDAGVAMGTLSFAGALLRPVGGWLGDRLSGSRVLLVLMALIALCDSALAWVRPSLGAALASLGLLYLGFGLGNGATFQFVPHRWRSRTGLMTGIIGAAGGIGGFYLPLVLGTVHQSTGSYQLGFATFAAMAALAFLLLLALQGSWRAWSLPGEAALELDAAVSFDAHP